ncbi:hypothetical protein BACCIP111883_02312 [Sutcliffiella rhizosphaerae]|uniref:Nudix hydrolase domain-containing protein n=1 Tax=Sutcliffiella rhizosphaerae TaxID=2880967 RepID=A0ABM8YNH4_9BACI|nr:hypothetical protein BACCIP111883_02312 [Sutcliffiella rhizosphaerae]
MKNFIITSGAVVLNSERHILLKKDPIRGWELLGGKVENNESIQDASLEK